MHFPQEHQRISLEKLAEMIGVSSSTARTWISSYKFNKFVKYDNILGQKPKLNIVLNNAFCKTFIPYLASKGIREKNYVKNFNDYLDKHHRVQKV